MRCDRAGLTLAVTAALIGCGRRPAPRGPDVTRLPTPQIKLGECAPPEQVGAAAARRHADLDLDGDGTVETIVADGAQCQGDNCYWHVFIADPGSGCTRFAGTVAGTALQLEPVAEGRWPGLRTYWQLGGDRTLLHTYRFLRGGYQLTDALVCRAAGADRVECAESHGTASAP
ncbi:MAG: hypothetical protein R3B06_10715 [Kofleriaceae bacterium]